MRYSRNTLVCLQNIETFSELYIFCVVFFEIQYCVKIVYRFKTVISIRSVSGLGDTETVLN